MRHYGYMGKILYVNLTSEDIKEEELDFNLVRKFVGEFGINARLAYDLIKPGINPLSDENPIIIGAGPLAGTSVPGASRCSAWTKWPLTDTIGPGGGPMGFGGRLKYAGYDHLVITGRADKPVYLQVSDDDVKICDADVLWGKDLYEATDELWKRCGVMNGVICIGQAGENLAKISMAFIDKNGTLGRFGLGAVMGSKKLKAIVAGGRKGVKVSDVAKFTKMSNELLKKMVKFPKRAEYVDLSHYMCDFDRITENTGAQDYLKSAVDVAEMRRRWGPEVYKRLVKVARLACPGCPIACRDISKVPVGAHKGQMVYAAGPQITMGPHLKLKDIGALERVADLMQRYGLDKYGVTGGIEFLLELTKQGVAFKEDLEGFELGNEEATCELIDKIAFRRGIGNVIADGRKGMISKFGREAVEKYGIYIKGADTFHEPRASKLGPMYLDLVVNPIGPNQGKGGMVHPGKFDKSVTTETYQRFAEMIGIPEENMDRILDSPYKINPGRLLSHLQRYHVVYSTLSLCMRFHMAQFYNTTMLAELYSAATGIEIDAYELNKAGERTWNLYKMLNDREGQSRKDDTFPSIWFEPLKAPGKEIRLMDYYGTKVLTPEDLKEMLNDYYDECGWEIERGIPTKAKLIELELEDVVEDLEKRDFVLK